ncbi:MAG TPA: hypothetical protein VNW50_01540, partial [Streptosporangiaceae bacterium]|nr:hypothetical protein [Streptosporangiaceae bacterium]
MGGFGLCGIPSVLIGALSGTGAEDLEVVSNNCDADGLGRGRLRGIELNRFNSLRRGVPWASVNRPGRWTGANRHKQRAPITCSLAETMGGSPRRRVSGRVTQINHKCRVRYSCAVE